jgi:hypothetical protein
VTRGGVVPYKRRWSELSPGARRLIVVGATFETLLKLAALVDIRRRPASDIRGSKGRWATAVAFSNSLGVVPIAYFLFGRRNEAEGFPS